jgi:hypothetical protein
MRTVWLALLLAGCGSEIDFKEEISGLRDDIEQTQIDQKKAALTQKTIEDIDGVLRVFRTANKRVPRTLKEAFPGRVVPKDGWDRPFKYKVPGPKYHKWDIISLGADGEEGGVRMDRDILLSEL